MQTSLITDRVIDLTSDENAPRIEYNYRFPQIEVRKTKGGWLSQTNEEFYESFVEVTPTFDLLSGMMGAHPILAITPFEVIDAHQWHGQKPYDITDTKTGRLIEKSPVSWQVSAVNKLSGDRFPLVHTCANKDEVLRVNFRLNVITTYCQNLLKPFAPDLASGDPIPLEELRSSISDFPPDFSNF